MNRNRTARAAKHRAAAAHERAAAERLRHRLEIEHGHDFPEWDRSILTRYEEIARDHEARAAALEKPSRTTAQMTPIRDATQTAAAALATLSRALRDRAETLENIDDEAAENLRRRSEAAAIDSAALRRSLPEIP